MRKSLTATLATAILAAAVAAIPATDAAAETGGFGPHRPGIVAPILHTTDVQIDIAASIGLGEVYISGVVRHDDAYGRWSPSSGARVWVQKQTPIGWVTLARATTNRHGGFDVSVGNQPDGDSLWRVVVPAAGAIRAGVSVPRVVFVGPDRGV